MNNSEFLSRIRYSGYLGRVMSAEDAATFIRPGMVLGVSGFTIAGYPKAVAGVLADRARKGEKLDLTVYSGASLGEEFDGELARVGAFRARMPYIKVDPAKVVAVVESDIPDNGRIVSPVDDEFRQMAANLIDFLHSEVKADRLCNPLPPLQAGVGSVSNAVLEGLAQSDFGHLTVYSEVLQNSMFDLIDAGKVDFASGTSLTISADRRDSFFRDFERYRDKIILRPQEISNHPEIIRRLGVIAVNTVIEADLYGNTNSSYIDGSRLMNGVGGSGDYCQNAGLSIFITKSTAKNGTLSCIVPHVSHVDHTIHEIHALITEQGVADLRGLDPIDRANCIIENCAHPKFRPALREYLKNATESCAHRGNPIDLRAALDFNKYLQ